MTALTRASIVRATARVCFLIVFQTTGIVVPQLLAQSLQSQADALRKQVAELQAAALQTAAQSTPTAAASTTAIAEDAAGLAGVAAAENHLQAAAAAMTAPKKPGVRRIGLVLPSSQAEGSGTLGSSDLIRNIEAQLLTGPNIETIHLRAVLPDQAAAEARAADCDYLLQSSLTQQTAASASGRFGKLMNMRTVQVAATAAQFIPAVQGAALMTTLVGGQLAQTQMLNFSKSIKANSDVRYEYTLTHVSGTVKLHDTETLRSKSNGEDVLTPILTNAAKKIVPVLND